MSNDETKRGRKRPAEITSTADPESEMRIVMFPVQRQIDDTLFTLKREWTTPLTRVIVEYLFHGLLVMITTTKSVDAYWMVESPFTSAKTFTRELTLQVSSTINGRSEYTFWMLTHRLSKELTWYKSTRSTRRYVATFNGVTLIDDATPMYQYNNGFSAPISTARFHIFDYPVTLDFKDPADCFIETVYECDNKECPTAFGLPVGEDAFHAKDKLAFAQRLAEMNYSRVDTLTTLVDSYFAGTEQGTVLKNIIRWVKEFNQPSLTPTPVVFVDRS